jgi:hypothetical protein
MEMSYLSEQAYQDSKRESKKPVKESETLPGTSERYAKSEFEFVRNFRDITEPVLQMFRFYRLIVDEYT